MNNYTLTEIISAKNRAFKLKLYGVAAFYRYLELKSMGIEIDKYTCLIGVALPTRLYVD